MKKIFTVLIIAFIFTALAQAQTGKPQYIIRTTRADTTLGTFTIELFPTVAPLASAYFDSLVNIKFYDTTAFHRVIPGFVVQGGDPNSRHGPRETWGEGDPSQTNVPAEFTGVKHLRGIIGAARDEDINSANSQFFINVADNNFLNRAYTAYGQVVEGMDVVDLIVNAPRDSVDNPYEKIEMFITKGGVNNEIPDVPVLTSPENGAEGMTAIQNFSWEEVEGAVLYNLQISTESLFSDFFYNDSVGGGSATVSDLELGMTTYYWRVQSNNGGNKSAFTEARSFTTSIASPELISPENNSEDVSVQPELKWQSLNGASYYRVFIATSPTFTPSTIVFMQNNVVDTNVTVTTPLDGNTKYYWVVQGFTDSYQGPKSLVWSFTTENAVSVEDEDLPDKFELFQNYPNPFSKSSEGNSVTTIKYSIPIVQSDSRLPDRQTGLRGNDAMNVILKIYDILGREVATLVNQKQTPGNYSVTFDGQNLPAGVYLYSITVGGTTNKFRATKKFILMK
jgi:peptidyl-prolyl cis-trans isomerase B (cyclophilin B)